jgi:hypothetical protein
MTVSCCSLPTSMLHEVLVGASRLMTVGVRRGRS